MLRTKIYNIERNPTTMEWLLYDYVTEALLYQSTVPLPFIYDGVNPVFDMDIFFTNYPDVGVLYTYNAFSHQGAGVIQIDRYLGFNVESLITLMGYTMPIIPLDASTILAAITSAKTEILNNVPSIDLTPIDASLTTIKGYTDTLEYELLTVKNNLGSLSTSLNGLISSSLNGNGCEFMDGKQVTVQGRSTIYSVMRGYMGLVTDNSYTTFYDLSAVSGEKLTVPEALLTLYVAPIVP